MASLDHDDQCVSKNENGLQQLLFANGTLNTIPLLWCMDGDRGR